jgi:hypothetical protein
LAGLETVWVPCAPPRGDLGWGEFLMDVEAPGC